MTGIGMSRIGRKLMVDPLSLTRRGDRHWPCRTPGWRWTTSTVSRPIPASDGRRRVFRRRESTAVESALGLRPTWHNGAHETPGAAGSLIVAMLAVASGCAATSCASARCGSRRTPSWRKRAGETARASAAPSRASTSTWRRSACRRSNTVAMAASQHFARYGTTRETLGWIALNARANAALNPDGRVPRPAHHGRLPGVPADQLAVRAATTAIPSVTGPSPSWSRRSTPPATCPTRRSGRGGGDADHRAHGVGPGRAQPRATGARSGRAPVDPHRRPPGRRRRGRALRRVHLQLRVMDRGARILRDRRGQGLPRRAASASPSTAISRSTPTAASCPTAAPTAWAWSTRRSPSCAVTAGPRQVPDAATAVVSTGGLTPGGVILFRREG